MLLQATNNKLQKLIKLKKNNISGCNKIIQNFILQEKKFESLMSYTDFISRTNGWIEQTGFSGKLKDFLSISH